MADDLTLNTGSGGETLATDQAAGGEHYQQVKLIDGTADSTTEIHVDNGVAANAMRVTIASDSTGQTKLAASAGTNIGNVVLSAGTAEIGKLAAGTAAIGSIEAAGSIAHDAVGTGINPTLGGAVAYEMDGTAPGTAVAEGDLTRLKADLDGRQLVNTSHPASGSYNLESSSAQTATVAVAQPAAGFSVYITNIQMSAITAQTAWLHDEDDNVVFPLQYFGANTGIVSADLSGNPIRLTHAKALELTSTAAVAHSILINYYVAP